MLSLAALLAIAGTTAVFRLPFDAFPDTTPVMVQINVSAPGWAPDEIERQVTYPIERELSGLTGLREVRSLSRYGISQVNLIFDDGVDIYLARQQVTERMVSVDLPDGIDSPELGPVSTGLGEVFHYVVTGESEDPTELRTVQDWIIKPQLQAVPGVAEVNSWGGFVKQYHIVIDPNRLSHFGLSLEELVDNVRESIRNVPGGQMVRAGEQTLVTGVGVIENREDVLNLVVDSRNGVPIRVSDFADVVIGHEIRRGAATYQGKGEAVLGLGFMISGGNSHEVAQSLEDRLEALTSTLPEGIEAKPVYVRSRLVDQVLDTVKHNLIYGALLVTSILFMFLGSIRASMIVASAIPLSMLFAFNMMEQFGIAGSLMSLGAIDFGLSVDNAVIQIENSVRRLSPDHALSTRLDILRSAILEVRKPTLFGELIIMLVYLPVLTLQGTEGKLFRPMALTVVFVLLGSLILSFTVVPALAAVFLTKKVREREPVLVRWMQRLYRPSLEFALRRPTAVVALSLLLLAGGLALFFGLGAEFIPRLSEGTITINVVRLAGISLEQSVSSGESIERILLAKFPDEVAQVWSRTGTAELATDPMGVELTDVYCDLKPRDQWTKASNQAELVALMDTELSDLPGMNMVFTQPIEMRINELVAGIRSDVGIKLFGDDLRVLESKAEEIANLAEQITGSADISVEQLTGQPELRIEVDRAKLSRFDLSSADVLSTIQSIGGIGLGEVYEGQRRFAIEARMDQRYASVPEDIERIPIRTESGAMLTLDRVTRPSLSSGYSSITREWGKRRIVIQCNVRDRDVDSFVGELRDRIRREIPLDPGYYIQYGGQFESLQRARSRLAIVVPLALVVIFALLYWTYSSVRDALLIFTGVPLAALGGVIALAVRGMPFSISAGVGFVALSGIAVLNGLVLVSQIKRLRSEGVDIGTAVRQGALVRMRPVLMTALAAALGFAPMAISQGVGAEVQRPLASVVIGGIATSTALTLIVLPVLYSIFGAKSESET
jgi:cobalt-zinc-cadmium resistance protein CzcA